RADAGKRHEPQGVDIAEGVGGDDLVQRGELTRDEVDLAQARLNAEALIEWQPPEAHRQPRATLDSEQIAHRRPLDQVALQRRVNLVLLARALAHQRAATRDQPPP